MLQKVLVVLVGLVMSLVGALAPSGLFAASPLDGLSGAPGVAGAVADQSVATVRTADGSAFVRVNVLWVEVDGKRVVDDAWGTGEVSELRFKVGVKGVEGLALAVGDRLVPLRPTDVLTVRMFHGDFAFREMGTAKATLQLQGTVKTTLLNEGEAGHKVRTQAPDIPTDVHDGGGRVAYVVLETGEKMDTVAVEDGGARFYTQEEVDVADATMPKPGNLLARWVKVDGKLVQEHTWGDGSFKRIEFEPAPNDGRGVVVAFDDSPTQAAPGERVVVTDFVGEYLVYQVAGGLMRLRLDGFAADYSVGARAEYPGTGSGAPVPDFNFTPPAPRTIDTVQFRDRSQDDGILVYRRWSFGDNSSSVLQDPTHRFSKPGEYVVTLNVTDNDLQAREVSRTIFVRNTEPVPDFDFSPKVVTTDTPVTFTDRSYDPDGNIVRHEWSVNDVVFSTARSPSYRFPAGGNATVTLAVTDDQGDTSRISKVVLVRNAPPVAAFAYEPRAGIRSLQDVTFTSQAEDRDGTVTKWEWRFGDGLSALGNIVNHSFPRPGLYTVSLTVTDDKGDADTVSRQVFVENRPPEVDFDWSPKGGSSTRPVTFVSLATDADSPVGAPLTHRWDWGDGSPPSLGATVTHTFPTEGVYHVTLTVGDGINTTSFGKDVGVSNAKPMVSFTIDPAPAYRGTEVFFADLSTDPDGHAIVQRTWDFGDGSNAQDRVARHTYQQRGTFNVTLTVVDEKGESATGVRTLQVLNRAPVATANIWPAKPVVGHPVYFNATNAFDPDAGPNDPALTYRWHFSDQRVFEGKEVVRWFNETGLVRVSLTVTDWENASTTVENFTFVDFAAPIVGISYTPSPPSTRVPTTFTDLSTSANGAIVRRVWDFHDGSPRVEGRIVNHTFTRNGTHLVSLSVTDELDRTTTQNFEILVNLAPTALFRVTPSLAVYPKNTEITFADDSSDADGSISTWWWDFGDGTTWSGRTPPAKTFSSPGSVVVNLTVTDNQGAVSWFTRVLSIENQAPVARWHPSATPIAGEPVTFTSTAADPDGQSLVAYNWTFDDGVKLSGQQVTRDFPQSGRYLVTHTVSDGQLESRIEPGAWGYVRVHADHSTTIDIAAQYPNGKRADFSDPRYHLVAFVGAAGVQVTYGDSAFVPNNTLDPATRGAYLVLPRGTWVTGDLVTVRLRDDLTGLMLDRSFSLSEQHGLSVNASLLFDLPVQLRASVQPDHGTGETFSRELPLLPHDNYTRGEGDPVYRTMSEAFRGTGVVMYEDGTAGQVPASNAKVDIEVRWVPLKAASGARNATALESNVLMGWCRADTAYTNAEGAYTWSVDDRSDCVPGELSLYPAGRWEVRAKASQGFARPHTSPIRAIYVDPTGGLLWSAAAPP